MIQWFSAQSVQNPLHENFVSFFIFTSTKSN